MSENSMVKKGAAGSSSSGGGRGGKVAKVEEMKTHPDSHAALALLNRLVKHTAPLLHRRQWHVGCLKEFYPSKDGLLGMNVNRGQSILVRLRMAGNPAVMLPWHDVLGTMVHELTHMEGM